MFFLCWKVSYLLTLRVSNNFENVTQAFSILDEFVITKTQEFSEQELKCAATLSRFCCTDIFVSSANRYHSPSSCSKQFCLPNRQIQVTQIN